MIISDKKLIVAGETYFGTSANVLSGNATFNEVAINNGTSAQFLKADGSLDNNAYAKEFELSAYLIKSLSGTANGITPLDYNSKIPVQYIPNTILGQVKFLGIWDGSNGSSISAANIVSGGYYVTQTSGSSIPNGGVSTQTLALISALSAFGRPYWDVGDWIISNGTTWDKIDNTDSISSWNGRVGAITPLSGDYDLWFVALSGHYNNPSFINSLNWNKITNTPILLSGYGISASDPLLQNISNELSGYLPLSGGTLTGELSGTSISEISGTISNLLGTNLNYTSATFSSISASNYGGTSAQFLKGNGSFDSTSYWSSAYHPNTLSAYSITSADVLFDKKYGILSASNTWTNNNNFNSISATSATISYLLGTNIYETGNISASSFVTSGGASTQFVKGDGSLDNNVYLTSGTNFPIIDWSRDFTFITTSGISYISPYLLPAPHNNETYLTFNANVLSAFQSIDAYWNYSVVRNSSDISISNISLWTNSYKNSIVTNNPNSIGTYSILSNSTSADLEVEVYYKLNIIPEYDSNGWFSYYHTIESTIWSCVGSKKVLLDKQINYEKYGSSSFITLPTDIRLFFNATFQKTSGTPVVTFNHNNSWIKANIESGKTKVSITDQNSSTLSEKISGANNIVVSKISDTNGIETLIISGASVPSYNSISATSGTISNLSGTNLNYTSATFSSISASNYGGTSAQFLKANGNFDSTSYWSSAYHPNTLSAYSITSADTLLDSVYLNDSVGIIDNSAPTFVDNGDGTCTIGQCNVNLRDSTTMYGRIKIYNVASNTFTIPSDGNTYYLVVYYNSGTPIYRLDSTPNNINDTTTIAIYSFWRVTTAIGYIYYGSNGVLLSNKLNYMIDDTQPYKVSNNSNFIVTENNRVVSITSATLYAGTTKTSSPAITASTTNMYECYHVAGVWSYALGVSAYDNQYYDNGTSLVSIGNNKWSVRWIYRAIGNPDRIFYTLGTNSYNTSSLANSEIPRTDLPGVILNHCILVGKSIIQYNATSGITQYIINVSFANNTVMNHNDLNNIQGDSPYYHLSTSGYSLVNNIVSLSGSTGLLKLTTGIPSIDSTSYWSSAYHPNSLSAYNISATDTLFDTKYGILSATNVWTNSNRFSALSATNLITIGGTSAQFLKGDGSLDSNSYATLTQLTSATHSLSAANGVKYTSATNLIEANYITSAIYVNIGNNIFTFNHNLNMNYAYVTIYDTINKDLVYVTPQYIDNNNLTITISSSTNYSAIVKIE